MFTRWNKGRRQELKMLKYKKRLKRLGLENKPGKYYAFRNHSCPCSCYACSNEKYKRSVTVGSWRRDCDDVLVNYHF